MRHNQVFHEKGCMVPNALSRINQEKTKNPL